MSTPADGLDGITPTEQRPDEHGQDGQQNDTPDAGRIDKALKSNSSACS